MDSQLCVPEYRIKLCCLESVLQQGYFSFEWHSLEERNMINHLCISQRFLKETGVTVIVRAPKYDLVTVAVIKVELE